MVLMTAKKNANDKKYTTKQNDMTESIRQRHDYKTRKQYFLVKYTPNNAIDITKTYQKYKASQNDLPKTPQIIEPFSFPQSLIQNPKNNTAVLLMAK